MALSTEEKAANKAQFKSRDAAFAARKREYRKAREAAAQAFETSTENREASVADSAFDAAMRDVREAECAIDEEIAVLQAKRNALREVHRVDLLAKVRSNAWSHAIKKRDALEDEVDARFVDVANVTSAVAWAHLGHWKPEGTN